MLLVPRPAVCLLIWSWWSAIGSPWAGLNKFSELWQEILKKGAEVDSRQHQQGTPLMIAAKNGHLHVVEVSSSFPSFCLSALQTCWEDNMIGTLAQEIHIRSAGNHFCCAIQALISWGANIDAQSNTNNTPLLWAARERHQTIVEALILAGVLSHWLNGFLKADWMN